MVLVPLRVAVLAAAVALAVAAPADVEPEQQQQQAEQQQQQQQAANDLAPPADNPRFKFPVNTFGLPGSSGFLNPYMQVADNGEPLPPAGAVSARDMNDELARELQRDVAARRLQQQQLYQQQQFQQYQHVSQQPQPQPHVFSPQSMPVLQG